MRIFIFSVLIVFASSAGGNQGQKNARKTRRKEFRQCKREQCAQSCPEGTLDLHRSFFSNIVLKVKWRQMRALPVLNHLVMFQTEWIKWLTVWKRVVQVIVPKTETQKVVNHASRLIATEDGLGLNRAEHLVDNHLLLLTRLLISFYSSTNIL